MKNQSCNSYLDGWENKSWPMGASVGTSNQPINEHHDSHDVIYIFFSFSFLPTPLFGMGVDEAFPAVEINALIHSGLGFS